VQGFVARKRFYLFTFLETGCRTRTCSNGDGTPIDVHLPGLDIEIIQRRSLNDEAEQISVNLKAIPSFEAFGRFLETANPFTPLGSSCPNGMAPLAECRTFGDAAPEHRLDAPEVKLEWERNRIQRVASVLAASLVLPLYGASHRRKLLLGSMACVRHLLHRFG
jgi:hypothetical protein